MDQRHINHTEMNSRSVCQFVTASSVREDIVRLLSKGRQPTTDLIEQLDACRSGVYKELSNLEQQGALTEGSDGWELTACGQLVTDTIARRQATEQFLARDAEYWCDHSLDLLPDRFRRRLPDIGEYEVVRGGMPAVNEHVTELASRVEASDNCKVVTPVFFRGLEEAIPDSPETQVLVTADVLDRLLDTGGSGGRPTLAKARIRALPTEFGLCCIGDSLCLVFPDQDGEWSATLISETDAAVQWGADLFEALWSDADRVDRHPNKTRQRQGRIGMVGPYPDRSPDNSSSPY
jgi:predicted transcriptional regulator